MPALLWMGLIFSASSDQGSFPRSSRIIAPIVLWLFPHASEGEVHAVVVVVRKCGHLTEYAVFALLVWRALHQSKNHLPAWSWPKVGGTLLLVFLFAATDEFHQSFVPTRTPLVSDVFIDTAGGALGLLLLWFVHHFRRRRQKKEP